MKVLFENNRVILREIETREDAHEFGKGAGWCTAPSRGAAACRYSDYGPERGRLFIVHGRKDNRWRPKYQIFHSFNGSTEIKSRGNHDVLLASIVSRYEELIDPFQVVTKEISDEILKRRREYEDKRRRIGLSAHVNHESRQGRLYTIPKIPYPNAAPVVPEDEIQPDFDVETVEVELLPARGPTEFNIGLFHFWCRWDEAHDIIELNVLLKVNHVDYRQGYRINSDVPNDVVIHAVGDCMNRMCESVELRHRDLLVPDDWGNMLEYILIHQAPFGAAILEQGEQMSRPRNVQGG